MRMTDEERYMKEVIEELEIPKPKHIDYVPMVWNPFEVAYIEKKEMKDVERSEYVSLNRSKQNLIGICRANKWDFFVTFTFNPKLVDSSNYEEVCQKACKWFNNLKERYCPDMKYLLVPELHKNGTNYHLHGLIANCKGLKMTVSGKFDKKGNIIYNIPKWKYGWNTATSVSHSGKVSNYISKYITKDTNGLLKGKRRYWASKNVLLPKDVCDELFVEDYKEVITRLAPQMKFIKNTYVSPCNRNIYYIEI